MTIKYSTKPTSPLLHGLVESIWCYQSVATHEYEHVLPMVTSQLLINLNETQLRHWSAPGKLLCTVGPIGAQGALTKPLLIDTEQKRHICGVAFSCFGLSAFCQHSALIFTDSLVDGCKLWSSSASDLHAAVYNESDNAKRCEIIESFLLEKLCVDHNENALVSEIISMMQADIKISDIRTKLGISQRLLHRLFETRIGVRPKIYDRINRFSSALDSASRVETLSQLAFEAGFADQAHFSREFRSFTGNPPSLHQPVENEQHHAHTAAYKIFKTPDAD